MEENNELEQYPEPDIAPPQRYEPRVRMVLLAQITLFILGSGLGALIYGAIAMAAGWNPTLALTPDSPEPERWQMRLQLGLGHLLGFLGSGAMTIWIFYRSITGVKPDWQDYLKVRKAPGLATLGLSMLLMGVSIPLVLYSLNLNQLIPLPEIFRAIEDQTDLTIRGLLTMTSIWEFLANLTIIAVLPAIGEELVFRGVVQQQLMRRIANPWLAILAASIIFSLAHFQLEGFLPRMLLGALLGWLYWKTGNFWITVAAHFFNNGIQVFGQYLYGNKISTVDLEQDIQVPWEYAAISAFMVWLVVRQINTHIKSTEETVT